MSERIKVNNKSDKSSDKKTYYFIVNMSGGSGKVRRTWRKIRREIDEAGIDYRAYRTESAEHARELAGKISNIKNAKQIIEKDIPMIVVGGDGTINACLNGIKDFDNVVFGVIPSGSANDFAKGLGIPKKPVEALDLILADGPAQRIDIGQISVAGEDEKTLFGISSGIGLDAIVCKKALTSKIKKVLNKLGLGSLTYIVLTIISLFTMDYIDTEIDIYNETGDKTDYLTRHKMIFTAFMNLPAEGGGVPMAPEASPKDGRLSLCVAADIAKLSAFTKLPVLVAAKQERLKGFTLLNARKVVVRTKAPSVVHTDGEYLGDETDITVECLPKKLRMILPER